MPEPGFAYALYHQVTEDQAYADKARAWSNGAQARDLRQLALVADWCGTPSPALLGKIKQLLMAGSTKNASTARDRAFAALVLADSDIDLATKTLQSIVDGWWRKQIAPNLDLQPNLIARQDMFALYELMHVLRDNLNIDLRTDAVDYFKRLAQYQVLTYYPAPYPAVENFYRIPLMAGRPNREPDLVEAAMGRVAELMMVAYDNNATESQFLQGWLMNDRFMLKAVYGAPYEFLWANPYQPGLTYFLLPLFYHDPRSGQLFFRSSWQEDADWFGMTEGRMQLFRNGEIQPVTLDQLTEPLRLGELQLRRGSLPFDFKLATPEDPKVYFILGLPKKQLVKLEIDDEQLAEAETDAAGTLRIELEPRPDVGVFVSAWT